MIIIDGSNGEGGGQVLRTSLSLSLVTRQPFQMINIRSGRRKPGLLRQHLTAVQAAKEISQAKVKGDVIGSRTLTFQPGKVQAGEYHFAIGTAGSTMLVLQTVLPALMLGDRESRIRLEGGTHNPYAPPVDFLKRSFLPLLKQMGPEVILDLKQYGFYPSGGGVVDVLVKPISALKPLDLLERGVLKKIKAKVLLAKLGHHIAKREMAVIQKEFPEIGGNTEIVIVDNSPGPGNVVMIELMYEHMTEVITGFGEIKKSAEKVAQEAVDQAKQFMALDVPVGSFLADQLMIPFVLAGKGAYQTGPLSLHAITNRQIIRQFVDVDMKDKRIADNRWTLFFEK
jgi:RNA 3'-terminal phosphate cyclase (ATP)